MVNRKGVKVFPKKQEIYRWKKALETETQRLVGTGHNNLEAIKNIVSENTRELEQPALIAYINQCIEMSMFGNELVQEASQELLEQEHEKLVHSPSDKANGMLEDHCRKANEDSFNERRNRYIEKYFQNANVTK